MKINELRKLSRFLRAHQGAPQELILAVYRPGVESPVWDYYLEGKLEQIREDFFGWLLSLDDANLERLLDMSRGY